MEIWQVILIIVLAQFKAVLVAWITFVATQPIERNNDIAKGIRGNAGEQPGTVSQ